jgi:MFS family permease
MAVRYFIRSSLGFPTRIAPETRGSWDLSIQLLIFAVHLLAVGKLPFHSFLVSIVKANLERLTVPFNKVFGRRGTIFITCVFSALACIWQAFTNTWWHMFIARFALGMFKSGACFVQNLP